MIVMVKPLRFLPGSLYVRLIVMQSSNGQSQDDRLLTDYGGIPSGPDCGPAGPVCRFAITLGLDWVCIDMEHGHLGYKEVMEHLRVVRGTETSAIVRVPEITQSAIKRTLDIGAHGVIVPLIRSREDVERGR